MTRFFFDIRDNGELRTDETGHEFADLPEAIVHARETFLKRYRPGEDGAQEPSLRVEVRSEGADAPSFVADAASVSTG